jgi:hypothetical protein
MAKDKQVEKEYKAERLRRTVIRKAKRREYRATITARYGKRCPHCGHSLHGWYDDW